MLDEEVNWSHVFLIWHIFYQPCSPTPFSYPVPSNNRGIELLYAPLSRLLPKSFQSELQLCNNTKSSIPTKEEGGESDSAQLSWIKLMVLSYFLMHFTPWPARNPLLIEFPNNYVFYISICLLWAGSSDEIFLFENPIDQGNHFHSTKL